MIEDINIWYNKNKDNKTIIDLQESKRNIKNLNRLINSSEERTIYKKDKVIFTNDNKDKEEE